MKGTIRKAIISGTKSNRNEADWKIHASELIQFCPRQYKLLKKLKKPFHVLEPALPIGVAVTYKLGLAIEKMFVESVSAGAITRTLFKYKCPNCKQETLLTNIENTSCSICDTPMGRRQIPFSYPVTEAVSIIGSPDLIMRIMQAEETFKVYEIKSIKPDAFDLLTKAQISHEHQLKSYLWLIKQLPPRIKSKYQLDYRYGYVVYVKKTYDRNPIKVFKISLDKTFDLEVNNMVIQLRGKALPPRICNSKTSLLAKTCPVNYECFRLGEEKT